MVQVGVMRMSMHEAIMPMAMSMRLSCIQARLMFMLMMLVVDMGVAVFHRLVDMLVLVTLAHMQPDAQRHERRSDPEEDRGLLGK